MSVAKAVLYGLDGTERIVRVSDPPPSEWLSPVASSASPSWLWEETADRIKLPYRVFRLRRDLRSLDHRWMRVYNEGRSQTPEPGYVYMEVA